MRGVALVGFLLLAIGNCFGQAITQAPPPIEFPDWKQEDVNDDLTEYSVRFPSAVTSPYPENNTVPLIVFVPATAKGPAPFVLVLHYWGANDLRPERELATELCRRGVGAAIMTLPYHLDRTPAGFSSGELAIQPDVKKLEQSTLQSVLDVRRSIDFLATRPEVDMSKIGITGTSLGALVTELTFAIDPRIAAASFVLGGADFAHIIWNSSRVVIQRDTLRRQGYTESKLRDELKNFEPLTYLGSRPLGPSLVIGAKFDTVLPNASTDALIAALKDPKVLWLDTGHYGGIFVQRRLMREVSAFFAAEFTNGKYTIPKSLYAPTVRLGLIANTPSGFDVALGLDLVRFDSDGKYFSTLLVTPRGPDLFVGQRITNVLAGGAFLSTKGVGFGIFWSTVL